MRRLSPVELVATVAALGLASVGCQTYDFEPVSPVTLAQKKVVREVGVKNLKPNLWLLVDKSGSMSKGTPSRISQLRQAMGSFLDTPVPVARMALTFFPSDNECGRASLVAQSLPAPTSDDGEANDVLLRQKAQAIKEAINNERTGGGTPTGASIAFVGEQWASQPGLLDPDDGRDDFILLLTDGLPNCNDSNINKICDCASTNSCSTDRTTRCACTYDPPTTCARSSPACSIGCLDQDGAAVEIAAQKRRGIRTIVVAFGEDVTGDSAQEALTAMANAGGGNFRKCTRDADCGADVDDSCVTSTSLCKRQYYKAADQAQLAQALKDIVGDIGGDPCEVKLTDQPSSEEYIAVIVNGEDVPRGADTWSYEGGAVVFTGNLCTRMKGEERGMKIEVRYIKEL